MRDKKKSLVLILVGLITIVSISIGYAAIIPGSPFFNLSQQSFGPGQVIEGMLNFSLLNEPGNTVLRARMSCGEVTKNMTILEFLRKANAQFNCEPKDCNVTYTASLPAPTKIMKLVAESEAYYGLVAFGSNVQIQNISFEMESSSKATPVCYETPLKFDLLNDNSIEFEHRGIDESPEWCAQHASECFDISAATHAGSIDATPVCQKIWINKTGAVNVSVLLSRNGEPSNEEIEILIYDSNGIIKGRCSFDGWDVEENFGYVGCIVGIDGQQTFYIEKPDYYFVCVKKRGNGAQYYIKKESQSPVCGFYGNPPSSFFTEDYAIYVAEAKFSPFNGEAFFNETTAIGNINLRAYIQNYLQAKYNNNCSAGCIIPMKFISLAEQNITLRNLQFKYIPQTGASPSIDNNFYDLTVLYPKINASNQTIAFSILNFTAPAQAGMQCFVNVQLMQARGHASFRVTEVPTIISVSPLYVIPGQETIFTVIATAPPGRQIVKYIWEWGDGTTDITTEPKAKHAYREMKNYLLTVKAIDNTSLMGSRSFVITSNITKELLNTIIESLIARINALSSQYNALESWYRDLIGLNLTAINASLQAYKTQLPIATEQQLLTIKQGLDNINVPLNITDSLKLVESSYYVNPENIEPEYISDITGFTYNRTKEKLYQNAIAAWQQKNLKLRLSGEVKTLVYETTTQDKLTIVNIKLDPLASIETAYLIFSLPSGLSYSDVKWKENEFDVHELRGAIGFEFENLKTIEIISIALPGRHDFSSLVFYVSPELEDLRIEEETTPEKKPPWGLAIFLITLIILVTAIVLWLIWHGYSEKQEKKLFKNRADLYNLMNYMINAQAQGAKKEEIEERLLKVGWKKEQISYAWKKLKKQKKEKK
mgnify:CR=1 FL=1